MGGRLEVGGHGLYRGQLWRGGVERLDGQQLVDGGGLGSGLGEAVPGGQRLLFQDSDAVHQALEVLSDPEVGPGTLGRLEQDVESAVELVPGAFEVAERQFLLAGLEMAIRSCQQREDRILGGHRDRRDSDGRCRHRCGDLRHLGCRGRSAAPNEQREAGGDGLSKHLAWHAPGGCEEKA